MTTFSDLAEHTGTLVSLVGVFALMCCALIGVIYKIAMSLKVDILSMIGKLDNRITEVWEELAKIKDKQELLREQLPKEYLRLEGPGYKALMDLIRDLKSHFECFTKDCREGKCPAGRARP